MAIPLWRKYTRLTPEQRRDIIRRRRRDLDGASSRDEVIEVFKQDARDIRESYIDRNRPSDGPAAGADAAATTFSSPSDAAFAADIGISNPADLADARRRATGSAQARINRAHAAAVEARGNLTTPFPTELGTVNTPRTVTPADADNLLRTLANR